MRVHIERCNCGWDETVIKIDESGKVGEERKDQYKRDPRCREFTKNIIALRHLAVHASLLDAAARIVKHPFLSNTNTDPPTPGPEAIKAAEILTWQAHEPQMIAENERYDCPVHGLQASYFCPEAHEP